MNKKHMKIRKILFLTLLICFVTLFLVEKIRYIRLRNVYISTNLSLVILKDPSVLDVELLTRENSTYLVSLLFDDGGSLEVLGVNESGTGNMEIDLVDDYVIVFCDERTRRPVGRKIRMQIYSIIAKGQLETITDIAKNYHVISQYVNGLPDLYDHKNVNDNNISEVIDRLIYGDKLFSNNIFFINGYKYHLFKINKDILTAGGNAKRQDLFDDRPVFE
jgi:hypothetical protein